MIYYAPFIAALVALLSIAAILFSKLGRQIQDIPNDRSLHSTPVPRTGGVGLMAGILSGWVLMTGALVWWVVLPVLILFGISLLDDMLDLTVRQRLLAHGVAALLLVVGSGLYTRHSVWVAMIVLLFTVWMTNLYNFMDGSDGLAGGMALFGFACYGVAALIAHDDGLAMLNFSIAAAALGFLYHNFPPAKIFMGDAGSIPLGFLAAAMGLWGWQQDCWPAWFPLLVFSPFVADATATLFKRAFRREKLSQAHRSHYYQRLVQMGWGHRNTALAEYALMLLAGMTALLGLGWAHIGQGSLLLGWCVAYLTLMMLIDRQWREYQSAGKKMADA